MEKIKRVQPYESKYESKYESNGGQLLIQIIGGPTYQTDIEDKHIEEWKLENKGQAETQDATSEDYTAVHRFIYLAYTDNDTDNYRAVTTEGFPVQSSPLLQAGSSYTSPSSTEPTRGEDQYQTPPGRTGQRQQLVSPPRNSGVRSPLLQAGSSYTSPSSTEPTRGEDQYQTPPGTPRQRQQLVSPPRNSGVRSPFQTPIRTTKPLQPRRAQEGLEFRTP